MTTPSDVAPRRNPPSRSRIGITGLWYNRRARALLWQVLVIGGVLALGAWMVSNAQSALARQGMRTGYAFLGAPAGFDIGDSLIAFTSSDSFLRAYGVALLNTLKISVLSILFASLLGLFFGIGRLSANLLFRRISDVYVEFFRNTPQLVQIIFWYTIISRFPAPRQAWNLGDSVFLSNRGLILPWPQGAADLLLVGAALILAWGLMRLSHHVVPVTLRRSAGAILPAGLLLAPCLLTLFFVSWSFPALKGFNFAGGVTLTPELLALLLGLSLYIGAFLAEIVRSGIQSVPRGQIEAATSIGLTPGQIRRRVIIPQALRVMIPPAATQYVSILKNSSLGVAVGYPELFSVNNTIATLSGHAVEAMFIMMTVYLGVSFLIAAAMNLLNRCVQIRER